MCGISGLIYADRNALVDSEVLASMRDLQEHRGPDELGSWVGRGIGLAHRRLSIIGLADGQQPMTDDSGRVHITFNGEIYNYRELKQSLNGLGYSFKTSSDTEVLLYLYREYGESLVHHLRGMFAFAIWDENRERLFLARDRVGQKPLYYYVSDDAFVFASEAKSILQFPGVDRAIDPQALDAYLTYGFVPNSICIFRSIRKLPPAHMLRIDRRELSDVRPQRYWELEPKHAAQRSEAEWIELIREKLTETVRCHSVADVTVGAFLSGGVDSSVMVAEMSQLAEGSLKTFSVGFDDESQSELPYARTVAERFGTDHVEAIVTPDVAGDFERMVFHYDEPFADSSAIPTMAVARVASEHVKVVISGDGGDEAFGGYSRYLHDLQEARLRRIIPRWARYGMLGPLSRVWPRLDWLPRPLRLGSVFTNLSRDDAGAYANTLSISSAAQRNSTYGASNGEVYRWVTEAYPNGYDDLAAMTHCDVNLILPDDFLVKVDRASMAVGLEVRPPLVDHEFLELAASVPSSLKVRGGEGKWIFKRAYEAKLPESILYRRKQGFELPIDRWLRGPLKDQLDSVTDPNGPLSDHLDIAGVRSIVESHTRGTGRHGTFLWAIVVLGEWMRKWRTPVAYSLK